MGQHKTVIPGMENVNGDMNAQSPRGAKAFTPTMQNKIRNTSTNSKPIIGFLYSISKIPSGEFWPLKIGANTIGRSLDCDINLGEATVSEHHAELVVRQMRNPERMIASVCDVRSTCGTMINGESLGFEPRECFSGDIITIGNHYDLYLILIDAKEIGLNVCAEFMSTSVHPNFRPQFPDNNFDGGTRVYETEKVKDQNETPFHSGGTVVLGEEDENTPSGPAKGGTIFM